MTTTTMREFRAHMKEYFDTLENDRDTLLIPRQGGRDAIVIMTMSDYNSMVETDYLLSSEANRRMIEKAKQELESGDVVAFKLEDS